VEGRLDGLDQPLPPGDGGIDLRPWQLASWQLDRQAAEAEATG
jgi:hypothetical protein